MNLTFETRRKQKISKIKNEVKVNIDYDSIREDDIYGFYLTNRTNKSKSKELPEIGNFVTDFPKYFVLESEVGLYKKDGACVCWYRDDSYFDTIDGLYNAIIYKDVPLLKYYKDRYQNVKFFAAPDYSLYGDFDEETLAHNLKKAAVVYLWLINELDAIVFPNFTYGNSKSLNWCFEHIMLGSNVVMSLKGVMRGENKTEFLEALKVFVDTRKPKNILVYTTSYEESAFKMLEYATSKGVRVMILQNTMQIRNTGGVRNGKD